MTTPLNNLRTRHRWLMPVVCWIVALGAAHAIDHWVWSWATLGKEVERRDWWQFLRAIGYLGTWAGIALAIDFARTSLSPRPRNLPGLAALLSAALAGALAEGLKFVIGRGRPDDTGSYVWHGLFASLDEGNRGIPSSHAAVAFGGMFALAAAFPRAIPIFITLAVGCSLSRIFSGAHFFSDTVAGAALGALAACLVSRLSVDRRPA
jgi:membrane-associated phospholipid phosphatase